MSIWTHVAGVIRIDTLFPPPDMKERLERVWNTNTPRGSEGRIAATVYEHSDVEEGGVVWGYIVLHGDLRDYGDKDSDIQAIVNYLNRCTDKTLSLEETTEPLGCIRQGIVSVEVEYTARITIHFNHETQKWKIIKREKEA